MPATLFISDLHLSAARPDITQRFNDFLQQHANQAEALYILGDLFEFWPGDDILDSDPFSQQICATLQHLSHSGTRVFVMHGNRDLLLGERFCSAASATLLDDPCTIELGGQTICLSHGDLLCTDDVEYQAFRQQVHSPAVQHMFMQKPLAERIALIEGMRMQSEQSQQQKSQEIMDVNKSAVEDFFRQHNCALLIHGHTHRPALHHLTLNGTALQRRVLPDWYTTGGGLKYAAGSWQQLDNPPPRQV